MNILLRNYIFKAIITYIVICYCNTVATCAPVVVENIHITGCHRIPPSGLLGHLHIKKGDIVNESQLNATVKKLYELDLFADITIEIENNSNIIIKVTENPSINDIFFNGNSQVKKDDIIKELSTKIRSSYSKTKIKADLDKLYAVYQRYGYLNVHIEPKIVFLPENRIDVIFNVTEGQVSNVSNILFVGNNSFFDFTLKDTMILKEKLWFNPFSGRSKFEEEKLAIDKELLTTFYLNNGYADCKVYNPIASFNKKDFNFLITYFIEEGDIYYFNNHSIVNNNIKVDVEKIIQNNYAKFNKGERFSRQKILETIEFIKGQLAENGFSELDVTYEIKKDTINKAVDVIFNINNAHLVYINKINISGNATTKYQVIMREMMIHEGDIYDQTKINTSKDRLHMLGYFKKVEIKEIQRKESDLIDLDIQVEEQMSGSMNFSVGYSSFEGILGSIQASLNNILGYGYQGSVGISRSGYMEQYNIGLYDPYFIQNYNIGLGFNAFYSRFGDLGGGTAYTANIPYSGSTFGFGINSAFEIINRLTYSIDLSTTFTQNSFLNTLSFQLYQQLVGNRQTYAIGHSITWNQTNKARYATSGYLLRYGEKYATGFLKSQEFITRNILAATYIPLIGDNLILHFNFDAGFAQQTGANQIGIENLWSLGYYKMRGFSFFGLGPRIGIVNANGTVSYMPYAVQATNYYVFTAELSSPLFIPKEYGIKFATFVDIGSLWGFPGSQTALLRSDGKKEQVFDSSSVRLSVGVGIVWESPMGEIRFDYAQPILKEAYDTPMQFNIRFGSAHF